MTSQPPPTPTPAPPRADRVVGRVEVQHLRARLVPEDAQGLTGIRWSPEPVLLAEGWDNAIWEVGSLPDGTRTALRVARRQSALELLEHEVAVLRRLADERWEAPLRIPRVLATTDAAVLLPWVPGIPASAAGESERAACLPLLARTLAALHRPCASPAARNPVRGCPLEHRDAAFRSELAAVDLPARLAARALAAWEDGLAAAPWQGEDLLLHGDPHPANVVIPEDGGSPLLIDFGDTTPGDPASDLGALALHGEHGAALTVYRADATWDGVRDEAIWQALLLRARAWTARLALATLTAHAPEEDLGRLALAGLERL